MSFIDNIKMMPPVTKNLIIINVIIWLAMIAIRPLSDMLQQYGALYYFTSDQFIPSQLVTYMFIHANIWHLFFNMFALFMFGVTMERVLGAPKFLFYYISCGIGAALVQEGVFAIMIHHYASVFQNAGSLTSLLRHLSVTNQELFNIGINPAEPVVHQIFALYHTPQSEHQARYSASSLHSDTCSPTYASISSSHRYPSKPVYLCSSTPALSC